MWLIECRGHEKFAASDADLRLLLKVRIWYTKNEYELGIRPVKMGVKTC